ncbi:hypothetical protein B0H14DRAFT_3134279, partial [Mycena olivaceomarginata]
MWVRRGGCGGISNTMRGHVWGALWNMLLPKKKRKEARYARDRVKRRDEEGTKGGYCFVVECGCGFRWWVCSGEEDGSYAMRCEGRCERESWF